MSEFLFVGTVNKKDNKVAVAEALSKRLLSIPEPRTVNALANKFDYSSLLLLQAAQRDIAVNPILGLIHHIAVSIARQQLDIHQGHRQPNHGELSWLPIAKEGLTQWAGKLSLPTDILERSIFFNGDYRQLSGLERITFASIEPWGVYGRYEFAAGIGSGDLKPNYAPPIDDEIDPPKAA